MYFGFILKTPPTPHRCVRTSCLLFQMCVCVCVRVCVCVCVYKSVNIQFSLTLTVSVHNVLMTIH